jgi:hypothetical protein
MGFGNLGLGEVSRLSTQRLALRNMNINQISKFFFEYFAALKATESFCLGVMTNRGTQMAKGRQMQFALPKKNS